MGRAQSTLETTTPVSKLRPPHVRHTEISREALLTHSRAMSCDLLTICAPAGYGKSTLAIQWASRTQQPIAWVTLDESDDDAVVLLNTLCAALTHVDASFRPLTQVTAEDPTFTAQVLPAFATSVAALQTPVTVVLDDLHTIRGTAAQKILKTLVRALPIGSQVAFVGRDLGVIPLSLWRGQGRTVEVSAKDLAFTAAETAEAVSGFGGTDSDAVQQASGGWPVAVFLLSQADSVRGLTNVSAFIEDEVLRPMPDDLRDFVMCTAALGTVNDELATAVSGSDRSAHFLADAITTVLIAPAGQGWYLYHPLLRDTVLELWRRQDPHRLASVQAAAARWYLERGFPDTAVRHAIDSGVGPTLAPVIWSAARGALLQGRTDTVLSWLDQIDPATVDAHPELNMTAAWANVTAGNYGLVLRHAQQTMYLMPQDWLDHPGDFSIGPFLALLMAVSHTGVADAREALALAAIPATHVAPSDPVFALCMLVLGLNQALTGHPDALTTLAQAEALAVGAPTPSTRVEALCVHSWVLLAQGHTQASCTKAEEAIQEFARSNLTQMNSTTALVLLTRVALTSQLGQPAQIREAMAAQQALQPDIEGIFQWYRPVAGGILAFASAEIGDHAAYRDYLSWCQGEGLCRQLATMAEQAYAAASPLAQLTPAEMRVWQLLKTRMTLSEIAGRLFLSRETVKSHTGAIYRKLGVASRREAQELAERWG